MGTLTPLKLVGKVTDLTPVLEQHSQKIWPNNENHRQKWLSAVLYLRTTSKKGWVIDKLISRVPEERH